MEKINNYNDLKNAVCNSINDNIVSTDDNYISLYEFIRIINKYIKPFNEARGNTKALTLNMNMSIAYSIHISSMTKEYKKYLKNFVIDGYDIIPDNNRTYINLFLHRKRGLKKPHYYEAKVIKNEENENEVISINPYYSSNQSGIKKIISFLDNNIDNLFDFSEKYRLFIKMIHSLKPFENELYHINILYKSNGFSSSITPNIKNIDENVYYGKYPEEQSISDLVKDNEDLILWGFKIDRSELPDVINELINKDLNNKTLKRTL